MLRGAPRTSTKKKDAGVSDRALREVVRRYRKGKTVSLHIAPGIFKKTSKCLVEDGEVVGGGEKQGK